MNIEQLKSLAETDMYISDARKQTSKARCFFEDYCNHSIHDSVAKLNARAELGEVYKHEQPTYGRVIYLFNDGSSMQLCGWGWELKVVEAA